MERKSFGFLAFLPKNCDKEKHIPLKICFYHIMNDFEIDQMIIRHENSRQGYRSVMRENVVELDTDADVTLEFCSEHGDDKNKVITQDEMKSLLHYIVFDMNDYERSSTELVREMNISILQEGVTCASLTIKDVIRFKIKTPQTSFYITTGRPVGNSNPMPPPMPPKKKVDPREGLKKVTAFETIGKDGMVYGVYQNKSMGIYLEIPNAPPSGDHNIKIIPATVDLMKGMSDKGDVAICPTVHISGSFEKGSVKMSMSHCSELSPAALEGQGKISLYAKPEPGPEGEGNVSRREISPPECEIEKEKVTFFVDGPGFYTVSIRDEFCKGKRVALVAYLSPNMPKNRRPLLHVAFYYPRGEIGQWIREQWEKEKNVCALEETTFILQSNETDVDVICEILSVDTLEPLTLKLETETLGTVPYECLDFDLDYTTAILNTLNLKLRVLQGECRAEIYIRKILKATVSRMPLPSKEKTQGAPEKPAPIKQEPLQLVQVKPGRTPQRVTDQMIDYISRLRIQADHLSVLVNALGYDASDFGKYISDNIGSAGGREGYVGTKRLLTRWRNKTDLARQRPELREALRRATLWGLAGKYLKEKDDFQE